MGGQYASRGYDMAQKRAARSAAEATEQGQDEFIGVLDHFYRKRSYAKGADCSIALDWIALHQGILGIKRFSGQPHTEATDTSGEAAQTNQGH